MGKKLIDLLTSTNEKRKQYISNGKTQFTQDEINVFEEEFNNIILKACTENQNTEGKYFANEENTLINRIFDY